MLDFFTLCICCHVILWTSTFESLQELLTLTLKVTSMTQAIDTVFLSYLWKWSIKTNTLMHIILNCCKVSTLNTFYRSSYQYQNFKLIQFCDFSIRSTYKDMQLGWISQYSWNSGQLFERLLTALKSEINNQIITTCTSRKE